MNLESLKPFIQPPNKILDIGANIGNFAELCKKTWDINPYVFSIEPNKICESYLRNRCDAYKIALLGKNNSPVEYYTDNRNLTGEGNSVYKEIHYTDYAPNVIIPETLDSMFGLEDRFDLIKIDTQGSEIDIMMGGIELIKRANCVILEVSIMPYNTGAPSYMNVISFMNELRYYPLLQIGRHYLNNQLIQLDLAFSK